MIDVELEPLDVLVVVVLVVDIAIHLYPLFEEVLAVDVPVVEDPVPETLDVAEPELAEPLAALEAVEVVALCAEDPLELDDEVLAAVEPKACWNCPRLAGWSFVAEVATISCLSVSPSL